MVAILRPPPSGLIKPIYYTLKPKQILLRLYRPTKRSFALFRLFGPLHRFDHHLPDWSKPGHPPKMNKDRGVCYMGFTLSGCLVECFGDTRVVTDDRHLVLTIKVSRQIRLLDLRGPGALSGGTVAAIAATADPLLTQEWARYFYEDPQGYYGKIEGIIYPNAHNQEDALVLFERAARHLDTKHIKKTPLRDSSLRRGLLRAAATNSLTVMF